MADSKWFLGLDVSTQSVTAVVIDLEAREVVARESVSYADDLPEFACPNGYLLGRGDRVRHAPPWMWVAGLEGALYRLREAGVALDRIAGIAGSAQQHATVYLTDAANARLGELDATRPMHEQLSGVFSRPTSPIWMDSSTSEECAAITETVGGRDAVLTATGSIACERFAGPQIRRYALTEPDGYAKTGQVTLLSAFLASVLAGRLGPIDRGDGSGMNLMDIATGDWHTGCLDATAEDLARRLPPVAQPWEAARPIASYFVDRFGFGSATKTCLWSGDNPCSAIGLGLLNAGDLAVSLGTSDTLFGIVEECRTDPRGEGHLFVSPSGPYMTLICFANGSLARERVRDQFGLDWDGFAAAVREAPPGCDGGVMLPWFEPENVPRVTRAGVRARGLDPSSAPRNCRAVVEAQMIASRLHSAWMGTRPTRIRVTGGASANDEILQIMANVHQCPVERTEIADGAALGAALRAAHATSAACGAPQAWSDLVAGFTDPVAASRIEPDRELAELYDRHVERYAEFESATLAELERDA